MKLNNKTPNITNENYQTIRTEQNLPDKAFQSNKIKAKHQYQIYEPNWRIQTMLIRVNKDLIKV